VFDGMERVIQGRSDSWDEEVETRYGLGPPVPGY
jgi:hypothetical protein